MILLDTNVLSELMKPTPEVNVVRWMDDQLVNTLYISAITRAEIELGIALLPNGQRKQQIAFAAQQMFDQFLGRCLVFGEMAAVQYGQLVAARTRNGRPITVEDAQIAAIALAGGLRLATRNEKDFTGISGLIVVNPWMMGQ
ncbi:type II toxin-antitoxin system VapC family toxin [Candidatus Leptofilum sp.]|uniref:type II toxin-antitoxin system VapC family toxin n=1 Tax=Candidatus Leptofilum sp. TaxID=3241576 RepID=UPI003B5B2917